MSFSTLLSPAQSDGRILPSAHAGLFRAATDQLNITDIRAILNRRLLDIEQKSPSALCSEGRKVDEGLFPSG